MNTILLAILISVSMAKEKKFDRSPKCKQVREQYARCVSQLETKTRHYMQNQQRTRGKSQINSEEQMKITSLQKEKVQLQGQLDLCNSTGKKRN